MRQTRFVSSTLLLLSLIMMSVWLPLSQAQNSTQASPQVKALLGWGPDSNTAGVQLALQEDRRDVAEGTTRVSYHLITSGFPDGKTYHISFWPFGAAPGVDSRSQIITDGAGNLTLGGLRLDTVNFVALRYAKGEPFRIGLISTDETVKAFAKAFPFPIEARDGSCHLWMELVTTDGDSFAVYGDGFDASDHVTYISTSGSEIIRGENVISSGGTLPPTIVSPAVVGQQSGMASLSVAGKSCVPIVNYAWGSPAMKIQ